MDFSLHLKDGDLGEGCDARCHGPSQKPMNETRDFLFFGRQDQEFAQ
jgi:hypothetical protein